MKDDRNLCPSCKETVRFMPAYGREQTVCSLHAAAPMLLKALESATVRLEEEKSGVHGLLQQAYAAIRATKGEKPSASDLPYLP
jgi:hypothetical protein